MVREQIEVLAKSFPIAAMKTGLLCSTEIVSAVARAVVGFEHKIPLIVDPVMIASSGQQLLRPEAIDAYEKELFPLATLITPNLDEAGKLLGQKVEDRPAMEEAAAALAEKYGVSILLKGGHLLLGDQAIDMFFADGTVTELSAPFVRDVTTHGTGCTYSAAITAALARGLSLEDAIRRAKDFVTASIAQHFRWISESGESIDALNHAP